MADFDDILSGESAPSQAVTASHAKQKGMWAGALVPIIPLVGLADNKPISMH